jgi:hypothetical protein
MASEMDPKDEAIKELAHVARELLKRVQEIDKDTPGTLIQALENKIEYHERVAQ